MNYLGENQPPAATHYDNIIFPVNREHLDFSSNTREKHLYSSEPCASNDVEVELDDIRDSGYDAADIMSSPDTHVHKLNENDVNNLLYEIGEFS